jgi:hypothetical protein
MLRALLAISLFVTAGITWADDKPLVNKKYPDVIHSVASGAWSDPGTWEGNKVPAGGARVHIMSGHEVTYDVDSAEVIRAINVSGKLTFSRNKDTRLDVGLIKVQKNKEFSEEGFDCDAHLGSDDAGERAVLEVGTAASPIPAGHTATIHLVAVEGLDANSCPAIVSCGGRMDFHGAPLSRTWIKLGATAKKGDTTVTLEAAVNGWRVGDRIIITPSTITRDIGLGKGDFSTEERTIREMDGVSITLDKPLDREHSGSGDYRAEVANLSRNVLVESAPATKSSSDAGNNAARERGHTMYHRGSSGSISYAEFHRLGKPGVLGRYPLHFHLAGDTMRGSYVLGASIWDSGNRWVTIHGTDYIMVRDCVGYQSIGHGFFLEDGTEAYNVLDRNLAVQALKGKPLPKQALPFDQNEGAGFWWANSLNSFTRNVSSENGHYGFRFEATKTSQFDPRLSIMQPDGTDKRVDIRTLPFIRFEDNEAHCDGLYGFNLGEGVNRVGPDEKHPFIIRNTKIWQVHYAFRPQSPCVFVENMKIHRGSYGVYHPNYDRHYYKDMLISESDSEPFNRGHDDDSKQWGVLVVDGLTFSGHHMSGMPLIQISDDNMTGDAESHFKNVKVIERKDNGKRALVNLGGGPRPQPTTPKGVPIYIHDYYGDGRDAKVVSTRAKDLINDGNKYVEEVGLTGDESRVAEVKDIAWPKVLDPIDDLPPATVITQVIPLQSGLFRVRGFTTDNDRVKVIHVNDEVVKPQATGNIDWEITVRSTGSAEFKIKAWAEDAAGNKEPRPHEITVAVPGKKSPDVESKSSK